MASQGKRADCYLRFLDKDGARGARLGVVHRLFTSEDADPGVMARIGPQRERFSQPRASGRCRFGEGTFASTHGNGQDAPIPDLPVRTPERGGSTLSSHSQQPTTAHLARWSNINPNSTENRGLIGACNCVSSATQN